MAGPRPAAARIDAGFLGAESGLRRAARRPTIRSDCRPRGCLETAAGEVMVRYAGRSSRRTAAQHRAHLGVFFVSTLICCSVLAPVARLSAEVTVTSKPTVDVIVVTARKRQERSHDVRISIIAQSG